MTPVLAIAMFIAAVLLVIGLVFVCTVLKHLTELWDDEAYIESQDDLW